MEYSFHVFNSRAADGVALSADKLLQEKRASATELLTPVIVCVGSDLAIGDSLGPLVGSMLRYKTQSMRLFLYGTLSAPVTAKEIKYLKTFLKETHPRRPVIAIDAAVGEEGDIGLIKIHDAPLYPGAGANKKLGCFGDVTVMGVVAEKSIGNYALLNSTRLNLVYKMAEQISDGLSTFLWNLSGLKSNSTGQEA